MRLLTADAGLILAAVHHHGHTSPAALVLLALALLAGYALLCLVKPLRKCPKCKGTRVVEHGRGHQPCDRCHATGKTRRLGATAVHRFFWSAGGDRATGRRRERGPTG